LTKLLVIVLIIAVVVWWENADVICDNLIGRGDEYFGAIEEEMQIK